MKKIIIIFGISIIYLFLLTGCDENLSEGELIKEKTSTELEFIENNTNLIIEKYLNGDYLENEVINWKKIKNDFNEISNSSSIIILDLSSLQIENNNILEFENKINEINSAIENESEIDFLRALKDFYKQISNYLNTILPDNNILYKEIEVKSYLFESLYYCMIDEYDFGLNSIETAENLYDNLMNNVDYLRENSYKVNRVYIAIQEMKLCVQNQEKENVISKYININ